MPFWPSTSYRPFLEQVFGTKRPDVEKGLVFVIMSFQGEGMSNVYSVIQKQCQLLGLNAKRADEITGSDFVMKEIDISIRKAEYIICDLTHGRPNVYYELGYAHGVGNTPMNTLLIARKRTRLHFDVAPLRVHPYNTMENLCDILTANLTVMIRETRGVSTELPISHLDKENQQGKSESEQIF